MSNRHIDFGLLAKGSTASKMKSHLQHPTNQKEQKRKNRIEDITDAPKKIWGNNAFKLKLRQMQDAKNYRNEADRVHSMIHEGRIPANREHLFRARLHMLRQHVRHLEPLVAEGGRYHHV
jgi:hypothetical protein